ncbi:hypothetical protein M407DRAFT_65838 [Tulasnella calospora MUT 4182]|uniref:DDE-1 domain-containing protein n=1 Tax=Tulasnella calospora MUT 4182 TaxID=1051891 RepID=A0A0C3QWG7_9AGAM|nr:hypothetical protein M407DRAFT_65838 [Tulasnella calospora MUT 4182]
MHRNRRYEDGHERADVVEYRKQFLKLLEKYEQFMRKYDGETCVPLPLDLPPGAREIVAAFHDESCFHANDRKKQLWLTESQQVLRQKSRGRLVHASDFIAEVKTQMSLHESEQLESFDARTIIHPGKNGDGYWDMKQLLEQVNKQMLFIFDRSSTHCSFAADALNAKKMNVNPGGKQPKMHATQIPMNNPNTQLQGTYQSMVFPEDHPNNPGEAKGMEAVLKERGLLDTEVDSSRGNVYCCMERCLVNQQDFRLEKPLMQLEIEAAGHLCLFLPKFHCELNPIEITTKFREQCDGTFPRAKILVPECLDSCPLVTIRRFFRRSWRYADAYRNGLTGKMADFAVKKYTSHRRIGTRIMTELDMLT